MTTQAKRFSAIEMSPAERAAAFHEASEARRARAQGPKTRSLKVRNGQLILTLHGGAIEGTTLTVPITAIKRIAGMSEEDVRNVKFLNGGLVLWWPATNVDIFTDTLIEIATGIRSARAHMAQAGSARTPAKAAAARENGKKGGRPRKQDAKNSDIQEE